MKQSNKIKDSWLIEQYRNGHQSAMALLVKRWHAAFCNQAYRYTKDSDLAKDIAQDAWIVIMKKIDGLETPEKFGAWGISIVNRKSIDWFRKNKRTLEKKQSFVSDGDDSQTEVDVSEDQLLKERLKKAITNLSEEQQQVIKLFYVESYGLQEISTLLKISKGTVKSRLFYAREQLKSIRKE
ncbi:MAG: RNA polymerase sigma factor, partial [Flavobacteriaceae bacterium]|nr:RNA polymerase sigma factor [Flavobacteriaceae bacterium]